MPVEAVVVADPVERGAEVALRSDGAGGRRGGRRRGARAHPARRAAQRHCLAPDTGTYWTHNINFSTTRSFRYCIDDIKYGLPQVFCKKNKKTYRNKI